MTEFRFHPRSSLATVVACATVMLCAFAGLVTFVAALSIMLAEAARNLHEEGSLLVLAAWDVMPCAFLGVIGVASTQQARRVNRGVRGEPGGHKPADSAGVGNYCGAWGRRWSGWPRPPGDPAHPVGRGRRGPPCRLDRQPLLKKQDIAGANIHARFQTNLLT